MGFFYLVTYYYTAVHREHWKWPSKKKYLIKSQLFKKRIFFICYIKNECASVIVCLLNNFFMILFFLYKTCSSNPQNTYNIKSVNIINEKTVITMFHRFKDTNKHTNVNQTFAINVHQLSFEVKMVRQVHKKCNTA